MNSSKDPSRIPDLKLERFLLGELSPEEAGRIQRRLERDEALQERLEALKGSNDEVLARYPVASMASDIRRKLGQGASAEARSTGRARARAWSIPALSMAAAAVVILLLLPPPDEWFGGTPEQPVVSGSTRIKGLDPQLVVFRKTDTGSERLESGAAVKAGDLVLLQYDAAGKAFGAIVSIDGRGTVTRHLPVEGSTAAPLSQGGAVSLGFSYELDDAPRWERFYLVTSDSTFELDAVLSAAQDWFLAGARGDSLPLMGDLHQTIFTLEKETGHE